MKRRAVLIEASRIPGLRDLPGARADIENYKSWLASDAGGAWEPDEVITLKQPSKDLLDAHLNILASADYGFIVFTGHGDHVASPLGGDTKIEISAQQEYSARALGKQCRRCTIVIDSCRQIRPGTLTESVRERMAKAHVTEDADSHAQHRALFDQAVQMAGMGSIFLFGCSPGEAATEYSNGGLFSSALLTTARQWNENATVPAILDMSAAFEGAVEEVRSLVNDQTPIMDGAIRRLTHYPFGVRA